MGYTNRHHVISCDYTNLQLVQGLFPEADGHYEVNDGSELVEVQVVSLRQAGQGAVERRAHGVVEGLYIIIM